MHETRLQHDLFTGELADTRTAKQKRDAQERSRLQQTEMFSARELVQIGVTAHPLLPLSPQTALTLMSEDPRTDEERAVALEHEAQKRTLGIFPVALTSAQPLPTSLLLAEWSDSTLRKRERDRVWVILCAALHVHQEEQRFLSSLLALYHPSPSLSSPSDELQRRVETVVVQPTSPQPTTDTLANIFVHRTTKIDLLHSHPDLTREIDELDEGDVLALSEAIEDALYEQYCLIVEEMLIEYLIWKEAQRQAEEREIAGAQHRQSPPIKRAIQTPLDLFSSA